MIPVAANIFKRGFVKAVHYRCLSLPTSLDITHIPLEEIEAAKKRIEGHVRRTPLYKLHVDDLLPDKREIYVKFENLQDTGSFKQRGACSGLSALVLDDKESLFNGVYTYSSGNLANGLGYTAKLWNIPCTVIVPDNVSSTKVQKLKWLGVDVIYQPYDVWYEVIIGGDHEGLPNKTFISPLANRQITAGNATIGLEILEDLPDVDVIICPYGGGGMTCGVGSALRAKKPQCELYAAEVENAAPLAASLAAGKPAYVQNYKSCFIDGMCATTVVRELWPMASNSAKDSLQVSPENVCEAVRLLVARASTVSEASGAISIAAAMGWHTNTKVDLSNKKIACVLSGGNIEKHKFITILNGQMPES